MPLTDRVRKDETHNYKRNIKSFVCQPQLQQRKSLDPHLPAHTRRATVACTAAADDEVAASTACRCQPVHARSVLAVTEGLGTSLVTATLSPSRLKHTVVLRLFLNFPFLTLKSKHPVFPWEY